MCHTKRFIKRFLYKPREHYRINCSNVSEAEEQYVDPECHRLQVKDYVQFRMRYPSAKDQLMLQKEPYSATA